MVVAGLSYRVVAFMVTVQVDENRVKSRVGTVIVVRRTAQ